MTAKETKHELFVQLSK